MIVWFRIHSVRTLIKDSSFEVLVFTRDLGRCQTLLGGKVYCGSEGCIGSGERICKVSERNHLG